MPENIIIFLPEIGIQPYARTLALLASAAARAKPAVIFLTQCTGQMPYCSMMSMHNVSTEDVPHRKRDLCAVCQKAFTEVVAAYNVVPLPMPDVTCISPACPATACKEPGANLQAFELDGFPVGAIASYDFSLATKYIYSESVPAAYRNLLCAYIENTIYCFEFGKTICAQSPHTTVLAFNDYASAQAIRYWALRTKNIHISCTLVSHLGFDASLISFSKETLSCFGIHNLRNFVDHLQISIPATKVVACYDDVLFRSYGNNSHLFSLSKERLPDDLCVLLGIEGYRKTVVVFTSSLDERYGLDTDLQYWKGESFDSAAFYDQVEWLHALQDYANRRQDVQFLVRVHPREGSRKRAGVAEHLLQLQAAFPQNTARFTIVWPDDPISSYDLMELADIVLVAWSTMGMESFRVGIPVLTWAGDLYYSNCSCVRAATTQESYFEVLEEMLTQPSTFEQLREGVRYYHWRTFIPCVDMSETVDPNPYLTSYWPKAPESVSKIVANIFTGNSPNPVAYNVEQWRATLHEKSEDEERNAIFEGIRALVEVTFCPPVFKPVPLWFRIMRKSLRILANKEIHWREIKIPTVEDFSSLRLECYKTPQVAGDMLKRTREDRMLRVLVTDSCNNEYYRHGKRLRRMSKMIGRLASYLAA